MSTAQSVIPQSPQPTPLKIFQLLNAYQQTEALKAAIELDLFSNIAETGATASQIAAQIKADARGVRILCDYLAIVGLLRKQGELYLATPDSRTFLSKRSPAYIGAATQFLCTPFHCAHFGKLAEAVRRGGAAQDDSASTAPENPIWIEFARGMASLRVPSATYIAELLGASSGEPWKVLDIAASHGIFGITIAQRNPKARIAGVDWPSVLEVTKENAAKAGVSDRYSTIPGSAFDVDFGSGYDVVLLTAFLHHFDIPTNEKLLTKIHAALKPGGRVATLEFIPNDDRISPPHAAGFSLTMLANTPAGDAYTFKELEQMFRNAGFTSSKLHENPAGIDQVIISKK